MKMKKVVMIALALSVMNVSRISALPESVSVEPMPVVAPALVQSAQSLPVSITAPMPMADERLNSQAYLSYKKRPVSELSKLIYLGDVLKNSGLVVMYGSMTYVPRNIAPMVTMYVRMNYKKETAEAWIQKHAYRNGPSYRILYVKDSEGQLTVLRDFLMEELNKL
jgi:hypothetical protein